MFVLLPCQGIRKLAPWAKCTSWKAERSDAKDRLLLLCVDRCVLKQSRTKIWTWTMKLQAIFKSKSEQLLWLCQAFLSCASTILPGSTPHPHGFDRQLAWKCYAFLERSREEDKTQFGGSKWQALCFQNWWFGTIADLHGESHCIAKPAGKDWAVFILHDISSMPIQTIEFSQSCTSLYYAYTTAVLVAVCCWVFKQLQGSTPQALDFLEPSHFCKDKTAATAVGQPLTRLNRRALINQLPPPRYWLPNPSEHNFCLP